MPALNHYYSDLEQCLEDFDEAFGLVVLEILQAQHSQNETTLIRQPLGKGSVVSVLSGWTMTNRPTNFQLAHKLEEKVEDAWRWLIESRLIKPQAGMNGVNGYVTLTELGLQTTRSQRALLDATRALPENLVHPRILARIRSDFRNGFYDKAVQDAFKQVEAEAREAAKLDKTISGEDVFKRAFQRESRLYKHIHKPNDLRELFCVSYRMHRHNPSHDNTIIEPLSAARMLVLASHLLFQLDEIRAKADS